MRGEKFLQKVTTPEQFYDILSQMDSNSSVRRGLFGGRSFRVQLCTREEASTAKVSLNAVIERAIALHIESRAGESSLVDRFAKIDARSAEGSGIRAGLWRVLHAIRSALFGHASIRNELISKLTKSPIETYKLSPLIPDEYLKKYVYYKGIPGNTYAFLITETSGYRLITHQLQDKRAEYTDKVGLSADDVNREIAELQKQNVHFVTAKEFGKCTFYEQQLNDRQEASIKQFVHTMRSSNEPYSTLLSQFQPGQSILVQNPDDHFEIRAFAISDDPKKHDLLFIGYLREDGKFWVRGHQIHDSISACISANNSLNWVYPVSS